MSKELKSRRHTTRVAEADSRAGNAERTSNGQATEIDPSGLVSEAALSKSSVPLESETQNPGDAQRAKLDLLKDSDEGNNPHAFVVMPFGIKEAPDKKPIDFDAVYTQLIKPSLIEAGFNPFRADEEAVSGDILTDMFQELLLADLVIADMSIDNANVFYELGVRHAFRKRGVVHIQSGRDNMPFDVFNVRTMPYHVDDNGVPDSKHLDRDKKNLKRITSETWASDMDAVHSPIFGLLTGLKEPDRRALRTPLATGFWREFIEWEERIAVARRQKRIGDILLLTEEISNPLCKEDAVTQAGLALRELGRHELALREYRKGLAVNPGNIEFRREEAVILNRMGRVDEAILKLERLLENHPNDTMSTVCLGRIYTAVWKECWDTLADCKQRREAAFSAYHWAVKSIDTYLEGFHFDMNIHEPGIKALNMACVLLELADEFDDSQNPDPDIQRIRAMVPDLRSTLAHYLNANVRYDVPDYWTLASLAEWHITHGDKAITIKRAYLKSLSYARKNLFRVKSSLKQILLFEELGLYQECTPVAKEVLLNEIERIGAVDDSQESREYPVEQQAQSEVLSILFSGHRLDKEDSEFTRFPADLEKEVQRQIDLALDRNGADWNDHGFVAGAACGSEIIFIEACLNRGMRLHVHLPCDDARYINDVVKHGGDNWIKRYYAIRNNPLVNMYYQPERVGKGGKDVDIYQRNARWALYASLGLGVDKLRHITLWNGKSSNSDDDEDGRLVSSMVDHTYEMGGMVDHVDITKLDYLFSINTTVRKRDLNAALPIDERVKLLKSVSLFSALHSVDLAQIGLVAVERNFDDGASIARQGEAGSELFIIAEGLVSVVMTSDDSTDSEIAQRGPGECVGEMAVIHDEIRTASLVAKGKVLMLVLSRENFRTILRNRPDTSVAVTRTLAERLIESSQPEAGKSRAKGEEKTPDHERV